MTSRFVACPAREKGESGRAFVERMLAALNTGGATALPTPPQVLITAKTAKPARPFGKEWIESQAKALEAKPTIKVEAETKLCTHGPFPVKECRGKLTAQEAPLDWRGRPDHRPTTKSWPPGPMGDDGRSTHRYVGPWPPKWASKWTTGKYPK
jgi:hypothetical protein